MCDVCKSGEQPVPEHALGVDVERGFVDGERTGTYMANVALKLRRKRPRHYLHRADPWVKPGAR